MDNIINGEGCLGGVLGRERGGGGVVRVRVRGWEGEIAIRMVVEI